MLILLLHFSTMFIYARLIIILSCVTCCSYQVDWWVFIKHAIYIVIEFTITIKSSNLEWDNIVGFFLIVTIIDSVILIWILFINENK